MARLWLDKKLIRFIHGMIPYVDEPLIKFNASVAFKPDETREDFDWCQFH